MSVTNPYNSKYCGPCKQPCPQQPNEAGSVSPWPFAVGTNTNIGSNVNTNYLWAQQHPMMGQMNGIPQQMPCGPCNPNMMQPNMPPQMMPMMNPNMMQMQQQPMYVLPYYGRNNRVRTWKPMGLVSNKANLATNVDLNVVNPWGIAIYNQQLWVNNNMTDTLTNYDLFGNQMLAPVNIRNPKHNVSYPSGIIVNCSSDFHMTGPTSGVSSKPSKFLIVTEHGAVLGYNPGIDTVNTEVLINSALTGNVTVYRGIAMLNGKIYCADFFRGEIKVFSSTFAPVSEAGKYRFFDMYNEQPIPIEYGPSNIVNIDGLLYVTYCLKDYNVNIHHNTGLGTGFVSVYDEYGNFIKRLASRGELNCPWAIVKGPIECGFPNDSLLVGNTGDGRILVFDKQGNYYGPMLSQNAQPLEIDGLWGLATYYSGATNFIYFTASSNEKTEGLIGRLETSDIITVPR
ncbi:Hypothetical protein MVR_LOCUS303 [uncultured virus]|nr:Hypothetical protein MVR_LOCUS303 [uncultured virus]